MNNLGGILRQHRARSSAALALLEDAVALAPATPRRSTTLGLALQNPGRTERRSRASRPRSRSGPVSRRRSTTGATRSRSAATSRAPAHCFERAIAARSRVRRRAQQPRQRRARDRRACSARSVLRARRRRASRLRRRALQPRADRAARARLRARLGRLRAALRDLTRRWRRGGRRRCRASTRADLGSARSRRRVARAGHRRPAPVLHARCPALAAAGARPVVELDARLVAALPAQPAAGSSSSRPRTRRRPSPVAIATFPWVRCRGLFRARRGELRRRSRSALLRADPERVRAAREALGPGRWIAVSWRSFQPRGAPPPRAAQVDAGGGARAAAGAFPACACWTCSTAMWPPSAPRSRRAHPGRCSRASRASTPINDFEGLLAAVEACAAVVTVSNVTAHLAGVNGTRGLRPVHRRRLAVPLLGRARRRALALVSRPWKS